MNYKNYNDYELISMVIENDEFSYYSLFEKYKPIVKNISKEFYDRYSDYGYDYDDFIQEGYVGFQNALNKYDSSKGALFYTFVELCIRRRLLSFTKNISLPKRNISNKYFISLIIRFIIGRATKLINESIYILLRHHLNIFCDNLLGRVVNVD